MKKGVLYLVFLILILSSLAYVSAQSSIESCPTGKCPNSESYCVYDFYGIGCPHCAKVAPLIDEMQKKYPNFTFYKLEIYFNDTNQKLVQDFFKRYSIKNPGIPAIFISDRALIGEATIQDNLESTLQYFMKNPPICPLSYNKSEASSIHDISPSKNYKLTISAVITAALVDSINPCAFAVLIFLLLYISSISNKKKMLVIGMAYIITVFIVYFLSGLGLFIFAQSFGIISLVFNTAAIISIIAGLINIKDFFWYGKGISLVIPEKAKPSIEKYIKLASVPAAVVLGILVSMVELPCTGGVYLAILSLLATNLTRLSALPWLFLYNLIFVLPLAIILFAVYFGLNPEKAEKIRVEQRKWLKLVMGLVMLVLGLSMLLGFFS